MTKVAFIICYNNELYVRECMEYISFLKVPNGVEIDIIGVRDADSMAAGYNAAMHDSDAKYKVYLHQDVFILNENFIRDIIHVFECNPEYGMLGVIGSSRIVKDANYYMRWNVGIVCVDDSLHSDTLEMENRERLQQVNAIDGMIMITQYDIEWREDIFDGFDFYDVSQSMEFQKAGYKVGVPHQESAWCNHVCGHSKVEKYDFYRNRFCLEYGDWGYCYEDSEELEQKCMKNREVEKSLPLIQEALETGQLERMGALLEVTMNFYWYNTQLCNFYVIYRLIQEEKRLGIAKGFYVEGAPAKIIVEKYTLYKFLLKRLENDKPIENMRHVLEEIAEGSSTGLEVEKIIAEHAAENDEWVIWKLKRKLERICNKTYHVSFDNKAFVVPKEQDYETVLQFCQYLNVMLEELSKMNAEAECESCKWQVNEIFRNIETLSRFAHIGCIGEAFYMAYFDVIEKSQHLSVFIEQCRLWMNRVLCYVEREEKEPLVSVLVSVYNGENIIEDTLKSIMDQSYKNLQIIVVDDGSSDGSRQVIDKLARTDDRIQKLYLEENSNVCKASNMGYRFARGKYLALIGHDDIWKRDKIEKQVHFMEMNHEYSVCFTLCDIIDDEKRICNDQAKELYHIFDQRNRSQKEWINRLLFGDGNAFCAPSALIRRECIKTEYLYRFGILQLQDMALWLDLMVEYPVYILQERLVLYRKFLNKESNLSAPNRATCNRLQHENSFIQADWIKKLSDEKLCGFLQEHFRNKNASSKAELLCERAFILKDIKDGHCIDMFMELFENEETRKILEDEYNFKLKDFYAMNAETFRYDSEPDNQLREIHESIHQYVGVIERQMHIIETQQQLLEAER